MQMKKFILLLLCIFAVNAWAFPCKECSELNAEFIRNGMEVKGERVINDTSWKVKVDGKEYKCDYSNTGSKEIICKE